MCSFLKTLSLRKAAHIPEPVFDAHRGQRRLALKGMWTPRALDILPGDIFTADDTTPIWGWWVPWREDKEHPFGVKLLQGQFLPVIDVASQCCITFVLIAREKSSYRASDIWHLFGHTFETIGLPRLGPGLLAQLQALTSGPLPVTPLIVSPRALDVPGVKVIVDAQGLVAKRYDGQAGTTYLLRPDQHVAARWRQFDSKPVQQAVARATGQ